jgi:hypothetical protein
MVGHGGISLRLDPDLVWVLAIMFESDYEDDSWWLIDRVNEVAVELLEIDSAVPAVAIQEMKMIRVLQDFLDRLLDGSLEAVSSIP